MFDPMMRRLIDRPLDSAGAWLGRAGVRPNTITLAGLAVGLLIVPVLAGEHYWLALAMILLNRLLDGLDGAIARRVGATAFGGYLDIVCDATFYGAVPLGFALATPANAPWAALLLACFVATMTSFLGRAVMAAKRREEDTGERGRKSFFYAAGIVEGAETIAAFVAFCLFPGFFPLLAAIMTALCAWTVVARVLEAAHSSDRAD